MIKVEVDVLGIPKSRCGLCGRKATLNLKQLVLAFSRPVNHTVSPRNDYTKKPVSSRVVTSSQPHSHVGATTQRNQLVLGYCNVRLTTQCHFGSTTQRNQLVLEL